MGFVDQYQGNFWEHTWEQSEPRPLPNRAPIRSQTSRQSRRIRDNQVSRAVLSWTL